LYTRGGGGRLSADYSFNNVRGNRKIKQILFGIKNATTTNNTFYNKRTFPIRIVGEHSVFKTDEQWRSYIVGGSYNEIDYRGIIPQYDITDHYHNSMMPMTEEQLNRYNISGLSKKIKFFANFDMEYNEYKSGYLVAIAAGLSETELPNYYALVAASNVGIRREAPIDMDSEAHRSLSLADAEPHRSFDPTVPSAIEAVSAYVPEPFVDAVRTDDPEPKSHRARDLSMPMAIYEKTPFYKHATLDGLIPKGRVRELFKFKKDDKLSTEKLRNKEAKVMNKYLNLYTRRIGKAREANPRTFAQFRNIFFNSKNAFEYLKPTFKRNKKSELFPMNINLRFKTEHSGLFVKLLNDCDLDSKFMTGVYMAFATNSNRYRPRKRNFVEMIETPLEKMDEEGFPYNVFEIKNSTKRLRLLNLFEWWDRSYNSGGIYKNINFVGRIDEGVDIATDSNRKHRFENTFKHLKFASLFRDFLEERFSITNRNYLDILKGKESYTETIMYRIVKSGAPLSAENRKPRVIQNYWIMNSEKLDVLDFFDTQVHYDKKYRYDVYAYKLIVGTRYKYKDLRISKRISSTTPTDSLTEIGDAGETCLSFYDPYTGEKLPPLASFGNRTPTSSDEVSISIGSEAIGGTVDEVGEIFGLGAPDFIKLSKDPFVADANIEIEPSVQISEVPLFSYVGQVLDNAPAKAFVEPFMVTNREKTMAFRVRTNEITKSEQARIVSPSDIEYRRKYIKSHSLPLNSEITYNSISPLTNVLIYRLTEAPDTWEDFNDSLYDAKPIMPGSAVTLYFNKIKTNMPYYYMFRTVNSHGTSGQASEVYKVELIQEGDIIYPRIEIYSMPTKKDLQLRTQELTKTFKRLLRIQPSIVQRMMNDNQMAKHPTARGALKHIRLGAGVKNSIWDQKFKIRLTSKQTGKVIDLNVKFLLKTEKRSPEPSDAEYDIGILDRPIADTISAATDIAVTTDPYATIMSPSIASMITIGPGGIIP
tara:strand:+ start:64 stop:3018 length:2955 start_codon:yes stop_codon:yes gene_type:complete